MVERKIKELPKANRRIVEALLKAGIEPAPEQVNVDVSVAIVPRATSDAGSEISEISAQFLLGLIARLKRIDVKSKLTVLNLFPTMVDPKVVTFKDEILYSKKNTSVAVMRNIDRTRWRQASFAAKVDLFAENVVDSLAMIDEKTLCPSDRQKLSEAVEVVREAVRKAHK